MGSWVGDGWNEPREYCPGPAEEEAYGKLDETIEFIEAEVGKFKADWKKNGKTADGYRDGLSSLMESLAYVVEEMVADSVWRRYAEEMEPVDYDDGPDRRED